MPYFLGMYFYNNLDLLTTAGCAILASVSIPLHIYIFYVLTYKSKGEISTFFSIWKVSAVLDIISLIVNYLGAIFPRIGMFDSLPVTYGKIYLYLAWMLHLNQSFTSASMGINRFLAVCNPTYCNGENSNAARYIYFFVQLVPGTILASPILSQDVYWLTPADNSLLIKFSDDYWKKQFYMMTTITFSILTFIIISSYILLIIRFKRNSKSTIRRNSMSESRKQQERSLHIIAFVVSNVEISQNAFSLFKSLYGNLVDTYTTYIILNVLQHLYCCISPFLLVIFSSKLRLHFTEEVRGKTSVFRRNRMSFRQKSLPKSDSSQISS